MTTEQFCKKFEINQDAFLIEKSDINELTNAAIKIVANPLSQEDVNTAAVIIRHLISLKAAAAAAAVQAAANREALGKYNFNTYNAEVVRDAIKKFLIKQ